MWTSVASRYMPISNTVARDTNELAMEPRECWQDVKSTHVGLADPGANKLQHTLSPSEVGAVTNWAWLGPIEPRLCCAASPLRDDSIQAPLRAIRCNLPHKEIVRATICPTDVARPMFGGDGRNTGAQAIE
jgi:hypothetical protein